MLGGFNFFLPEKTAEKASFFCFGLRHIVILGVYGVTHGAIGHGAIFFNGFSTRFYVIYVVQSVEDTHHVQPGSYRVTEESVDDFVGIGCITVKIASA